MSYVTSQSSESFRRVCRKTIVIVIAFTLALLIVTLLGCKSVDLPGGMSDQAFHVEADGQKHILTGYINNSDADMAAVIIYSDYCEVVNNTPFKHSLRVAKIQPDGSILEVLAKKVRYKAQLKEGLYLITAFTPEGHMTDFCQVNVIPRDRDQDN